MTGQTLRNHTPARDEDPQQSPEPSLTRRASLNTVAAGLDYGALTTVEFVVNPVLVSALGTYLYGAWRVLWKLTGYLWATSGRSAPALQWAIASKQHSTDYAEKRRYVGAAVGVWCVFLPVLLTVGGLGAWFAPRFLRTPPEYVGTVRLAAALLVADSIALTLLSLPRAALQGENLGFKRMGLSALLVLVGGGVTILVVHLDMGMVGVAGATLVNTLLMAALFWRVARTHVSWFGWARPSRRELRWFLGLSGWFTVWKFVSELMAAGDVVVLALFAPVELVTVYTLSRFVADALTGLLAKPLQGLAPGLSGIIGTRDFGRAVRIRSQFMSLTWLVAAVAGATILVWNRSFVSLWVGPRHYSGELATLLIVVMALQFVLIRNDAWMIDLTLKVRPKALFGALSTILSIALAAVLVGVFDGGIVGLAIGFIAGRSVLSLAYPWLVGRSIEHRPSAQLRGAVRPLAATILLFAAGAALGQTVAAATWMGLVLGAGATALIGALLAWTVGLNREQRASLVRRLRDVGRMARRAGRR